MPYSEFFGFVHTPFERPLPPLPIEDRAHNGHTAEPTHVLRKRSFVGASDPGTRGTTRADEIFERAQERREQRKLKRLAASVKAQATTFDQVKSPGNPHAVKSPRPAHTLDDISNRLNAPNKLTRKSPDRDAPNGWYRPKANTVLTAPAGSRQKPSTTQDPYTPYSESRGELQRQFAISQRLQRKHQPGSPNPAEVGAYLGGLERLHDEDGWVDGFRLEVEKPLQRVYARRLQASGRESIIRPEKPTKVRFAPVVECFEF